MRAPISELCTGEPPGELISSATASGLPRRKAFSRSVLRLLSLRVPRVPAAIVPCILTTDTVGPDFTNGINRFMMAHVDCASGAYKAWGEIWGRWGVRDATESGTPADLLFRARNIGAGPDPFRSAGALGRGRKHSSNFDRRAAVARTGQRVGRNCRVLRPCAAPLTTAPSSGTSPADITPASRARLSSPSAAHWLTRSAT